MEASQGHGAKKVEPEDQRLAYQLAHTEHVMRLALDRVLGTHGLTLLGWAVLSQIGRQPGVSGAELTRRIFISQQAVSKLLARLVRYGLVTHVARPGRARIQDYRVTGLGGQVAGDCDQAVMAVEWALRDGLGENEAALLLDRLERCRAILLEQK